MTNDLEAMKRSWDFIDGNELIKASVELDKAINTAAQTRRMLVNRFGRMYQSAGKIGDSCTYCGIVSTTMDHVPSLTVAGVMYEKFRQHFTKVPACSECNDTLNNMDSTSVFERRRYLLERYNVKYGSVLSVKRNDFGIITLKERLHNLSK